VEAGLADIRWDAPWLAPLRQRGEELAWRVRSGQRCCEALNAAAAGVRFVPQAALPKGMAYERYIFETGQVPTREGLHDFFNGLIWLHFPQSKRQLNRGQAAEIERSGVGPVRGAVRDALTVFDENAVLLQAPQPLWQALQARQWRRLFIELRPLWAQARLVLFGHALMEKLVAPSKAITGHVYDQPVPLELGTDLPAWDAWLARRLAATDWARKPFVPLPVLGVPGWWAANEAPGFYEDAQVFRAPRPAAGGPDACIRHG